MHGNDGAGARADRRLDRLGIDGDGLVDVDDHRDGADGEHGGGRGHIGVRGDEHLIAGADADADHRRGQRIAAAGGKAQSA